MNMECFYINLDDAHARRSELEKNFALHQQTGWSLSRFAATSTQDVARQQVKGTIRPEEKACFLSHKNLIGSQLDHPRPIFVLEDDAQLGQHTCKTIDTFLANTPELQWDILFTDLCITDLATMLNLLRYRKVLALEKRLSLLDLAHTPFVGSTAYPVNGHAKEKIFRLLDAQEQLDVQHDNFIQNLAHRGEIRALCLFPFVTTVAACSQHSQIQQAHAQDYNCLWDTFRRMIWAERDLHSQKKVLETMHQRFGDDECSAFGALFAAMLAKNL